MDRRFVLTLAAAFAAAGPALAEGLADSIVSQLRQQGFTQIDVSQTMLGRTRFMAENMKFRREIVINPRTGEILRDYQEALTDSGGPSVEIVAVPPAREGGEGPATGGDSGDGKGSSPEEHGAEGGGSGGSGGGSHGDGGGDEKKPEREESSGG